MLFCQLTRKQINQMIRTTFTVIMTLCIWIGALAQGAEEDHSYKPLTLRLNEEGSKYVRFILWHQQWMQTNNLALEDSPLQVTHLVRRSRFLAYAQISPKFLVLTHFGLNNLTPENLTSLGNNGDAPQLFLHDAWVEYRITDWLYLGGGLHYWKGLTRLASASTLNFMTMDQARPFIHWHSLGVTDQFVRHLGIYAKGQQGKFDYRLAWNNPGRNGLQDDRSTAGTDLTYDGFNHPDENGHPTGNNLFEGYLRYNFWDTESTKLPYQVGSYLGERNVLGIGGGFFLHPNGMYNNATGAHGHVSHFAADVFLDMPLSVDDCLSAYASIISFNYGEQYVSRWAGTGTSWYAQVGYKPPRSKWMPYVAFQNANYDGFDDPVSGLDIGINYFLNGHHAKLTLEYHSVSGDLREGGLDASGHPQDVRQVRLQGQIFL